MEGKPDGFHMQKTYFYHFELHVVEDNYQRSLSFLFKFPYSTYHNPSSIPYSPSHRSRGAKGKVWKHGDRVAIMEKELTLLYILKL